MLQYSKDRSQTRVVKNAKQQFLVSSCFALLNRTISSIHQIQFTVTGNAKVHALNLTDNSLQHKQHFCAAYLGNIML